MGKVNFEEYRQPWETGPHWELKREFLEKYQNDFPEDRLLCLAQAYSNIELMHCSYPDPVMLQIHELSKPLQGCKRFRETKKNLDEPELQPRPGKRSGLDDLKKPFKFINFRSVGIESSEKPDSLSTEDNFPEEASMVDFSMDNPSSVDINTSTSLPSISSADDPSIMAETPDLEFSPLDDIQEPFFSEEFACTINNNVSILSIARASNFNLIKDIAITIQRLQLKKRGRKIDQEIQNVANHLNAGNQIYFNILGNHKTNKFICEFYIGNTLISIGRDNNEYHARKVAGAYAMEVFVKLSFLPIKILTDLKIINDVEELSFIKKLVEEVVRDTQSELAVLDKIISKSIALNCSAHVNFFVLREDMRSPLHCRAYICDFVIKNVLICCGKGTNKKCAKERAAENGILVLSKYFYLSYDPKPRMFIRKEKKIKKSQQQKKDTDNAKQSSTEVSKTLSVEKEKSPVDSDPIIMNYSLLDNSFQQQFAIMDNTAIAPVSQQTPQNILNYSMQFCKKSFSSEVFDTDCTPEGYRYRCDVVVEGQCIGLGVGVSKSEAKSNASLKALQKLQNEFYTIKIKNEADDGFFIQRSQIINAEAPTNAVSDSNIGCKMLKMMGWSGGSLGNSGGITEPIVASDHRFHQGLGFSKGNNDIQKFRQKIESLLREFSNTETTSDLIFGTDFAKDERKQIHKIAMRFGLVSVSRGKGDSRQLSVKHKLTINQVLNQLVRAGGRTSKYEFVDNSLRFN